MTHDELRKAVAIAISGAPFPTARSLTKADAALAAIRDAGFAIVPGEAKNALTDSYAYGVRIPATRAMLEAAQEGKP
jgi:hypothetical protein